MQDGDESSKYEYDGHADDAARFVLKTPSFAEAFSNMQTRTLGIDGEGAVHHYTAESMTVTVIAMDGSVDHVEELGAAGRTVNEWMAFVDERRGWL